jgi:hypothetical protein
MGETTVVNDVQWIDVRCRRILAETLDDDSQYHPVEMTCETWISQCTIISHQAVTDLHTNRSRRGDDSDHQLAVQLQYDDRAIIYNNNKSSSSSNNNNNNNCQVGKTGVTIAVASINLDDNSVRLLTANVITAQKLVTSRECAVVEIFHRT